MSVNRLIEVLLDVKCSLLYVVVRKLNLLKSFEPKHHKVGDEDLDY